MSDWKTIQMRDGTNAVYFVQLFQNDKWARVDFICDLNCCNDYRSAFLFSKSEIENKTFLKQIKNWYDSKTAKPLVEKPNKCPHCGGDL